MFRNIFINKDFLIDFDHSRKFIQNLLIPLLSFLIDISKYLLSVHLSLIVATIAFVLVI